MMRIISLFCLTVSLAVFSGCTKDEGGGDRCGKFIDKSISHATEMAKALSASMPAEKKDEMMKKMAEDTKTQRPEMMTKCAELLKTNKDAGPVMDCVIASKDLPEAAKCDPDNKLAALR